MSLDQYKKLNKSRQYNMQSLKEEQDQLSNQQFKDTKIKIQNFEMHN